MEKWLMFTEIYQMKQLSELTWVDQLYNLVLLGPAGVGKTHLATALGIEAIDQGYQVMFITMEELVRHMKSLKEPLEHIN